GAAYAAVESDRAGQRLRRDECHTRAAALVQARGDRARRFWQGRKLCRAPDRSLVEAVSRLGNREDRRDGRTDAMAAVACAATSENAPARAQLVRPLAQAAWSFAREAGAR